ncbi:MULTISPECIES: Fic/DOC family protein [unclassified Frankia]|uniref:Fic/DOC family protein n=1 Tax=unclassified Frankia TaxID=2632575 RepID=UPI002AD25E19|nr:MULTISPECIES: Fic family protein [unclassified Frankia]
MDDADPYCRPGSPCLRNLLDIRDADELAAVEAEIVAIRDVELRRAILPGLYDFDHLRQFHRVLFSDVYPWAGEIRVVDIGRPILFAHWRFVADAADDVFARLAADAYLVGLSHGRMVDCVARYLGEVNALHPFREGNGRAQRAFFRQLAAAAGWRLRWDQVSRDENDRASARSLVGDDAALEILIGRILEPLG